MIDEANLICELEIDGGVDEQTAPRGVKAGANVLVVGSSIFQAADGIAAAMDRLR
jgi:ribulose-phosphate 3-epimerase